MRRPAFLQRALALFALAALAASCVSTSPDKRLLQYLNDKGFGNRYTGNAEDQNYVTIGDTVSISDAYHPELTQTQRVDIDGTVVLPEIGAVHVAGMTRSELEAFLTQKYSPYYEQLRIEVRITTTGKFYFVFGEVQRSGKVSFPGDLTVFEAVHDAGPDDTTANLGRVRLIRADPRDPLIIHIDISSILDTGDTTENVLVQERDIIYVPPTMIAQVGYFIADLLFPVTNVIRQVAGAFYLPGGYGYGRGRGYYGNSGGWSW
jgi:protein involved in polysaccharide export with SLBB domain